MTERESMDHPSGLPETKVSEQDPMKALDLYLKLAEECVKVVLQKRPSCQFNNEQCHYLVDKLVVVVERASGFLEVLRGECHRPCLPEDIASRIEIFKLLFTLGKQIESFVQSCSRDDWIRFAMTLTNASAYVSSIGFNLELLRIFFSKESVAIGSLTLNQVADINNAEVLIVRDKVSLDANTLVIKVIQNLTSVSEEEKDLACYLLQRLKQVKPIPVSAFPKSFLAAHANRSFLGSMFKWVKETTRLGGCVSGAMVDKATWLGTPVAVKTFYTAEDPEFLKEVDILEKLCHPNVISMFCSAMDSRRCSIVMELMDGDLNALMQRKLDENPNSPPFAISEAIDLMHQVAEGVNYLHNEGIEHRDLKSFNILVKSLNLGDTRTGYVHAKVADFGISKIKESNNRYSNRTLNTGTTRWMAPDIIKPKNVGSQGSTSRSAKVPKYSFKCDVYSFAMVCFEILTGSVPFSTICYPNDVNRKVLAGDRPELPDHCPYNLKVLIEKCWSQEPLERPSFEEICLELKYLKSLLMMGSSQGPHITIENPQQVAIADKPLQGSRVTKVMQQLQTVVMSSRGYRDSEYPLFSILRISFDMLSSDNQQLFMDVALYYPERFVLSKRWNIIEWLSMVNGRRINVIKNQLEGLKRKSLIADLGDGSTVIGMHGLWHEFCVAETVAGDLNRRRWVYEVYGSHFSPEDSSLRGGGWKRLQRICLKGDDTVSNPMRELNLDDCTYVTVLKLVNCHLDFRVLDFRPLKRLRSLEILSCWFEISHVKVLGLGMLKNLVVLKWDNISRVSPWLEEIGLLTGLQILGLESSVYENTLPDLGRLHFLKEVTFRFRDGAYIISGLSPSMTMLQYLDLGGCHGLRSCPGVGSLVELEELDLRDCVELEELPNLQQLTNLRKLDISGCALITALPGLDDMVSLVELRTEGCWRLELPDLTRLPNLRVFPTTGAEIIAGSWVYV